MTDQSDEQQDETITDPVSEEAVEQERREFLRSLSKWSQAVIVGVVAGGALRPFPKKILPIMQAEPGYPIWAIGGCAPIGTQRPALPFWRVKSLFGRPSGSV